MALSFIFPWIQVMSKKIAFFDRDGTINIDQGYTYKCEDFRFVDGVQTFMQKLIKNGFEVVIVTNQSGVARGLFTLEQSCVFTRHVINELTTYGIQIKNFLTCPHHIDGVVREYSIDCDCRKPKPGMLKSFVEKKNIDASICLVVGNKLSDLEAGYRAGVRTGFLVGRDEKKKAIEEYFSLPNRTDFELKHAPQYADINL